MRLGRHLGELGVVLGDGDDNDLRRRNARRQDQAVVVRVRHDDRADHARRNAPAGRPGELLLTVGVLELDLERLGEVLAEEVARTGLKRLGVAHHRFAGVGVDRTGEALAG